MSTGIAFGLSGLLLSQRTKYGEDFIKTACLTSKAIHQEQFTCSQKKEVSNQFNKKCFHFKLVLWFPQQDK